MSWWGKLAGGAFGFMLGGPLGALLGAAVGHNFDRGLVRQGRVSGTAPQEQVQTAFFAATFSVMGHVCKADGVVTRDEIRTANRVMQEMDLNAEQIRAARNLFNQGKQTGFRLDEVLQQFHQVTGRRKNLRRMFVEILCLAAWADGTIHPAEKDLLIRVCADLRISRPELEFILQALNPDARTSTASGAIRDPYAVLNIPPGASEAEVTKAYRRLLSRHHPDKLVARGLPEEMMRVATERTREIRKAYETIREQRGF